LLIKVLVRDSAKVMPIDIRKVISVEEASEGFAGDGILGWYGDG